jgi:NAD(P)-dependent dehydrogenase (short-subunit alcohol dehydrogenase family)
MEACKEYRNRFHQLDVLYCNAGVLPIDGLDLWMGVGNLVRDPLRFFTDVSSTLRQKRNLRIAGHEKLGLVFTANVLSHYVMVLLPD